MPRYVLYQFGSDYTVMTFTYGGISAAYDYVISSEGEVWVFRVQAVIGYFRLYVDSVFEGVGSELVEFEV